jgi:hypothetical protein
MIERHWDGIAAHCRPPSSIDLMNASQDAT